MSVRSNQTIKTADFTANTTITAAGAHVGRKKSEGKSPERRAEIVGTLYDCILDRGYQNTSVRDIATAAGIQVGALYYYFENKDEILYSLADYVFDKYKTNFLRISIDQSGKRRSQDE